MDFSKVKSITIPEGSVKSIACNGVTLWNKPFKYVAGQLTCPSGAAFNTYTEGSAEFRFKATFKLSDTSEFRYIGQDYYNGSPARGWAVTIGNGNLILQGTAYARLTWTDWTFTTDEWYTVEVYGTGQGTTADKFYASVNGSPFVAKSGVKICSASQYARNLMIGDSTISYRDEIVVKGTPYNPSSTQNSLIVNIEDATVGSALSLSNNGFTVTSTSAVAEGSE